MSDSATSAGFAVRTAPGAGPRVLWIHGYTMDGSIWGELWSTLPDWHHVAVDLPGHGDGRPLERGERLADWAATLNGLMVDERIEHVVALSFGTLLAIEAAVRLDFTARSLVLAAPTFVGGPQDADAQTRNLELKRCYDARGPGPWLAELWMLSPPPIFDGARRRPELFQALCDVVLRHRWTELGNGAIQSLAEGSQVASIGRVRAKTLLLVGEDDMACFKRTAEIIRRTLRCRRTYMPDAGHLPLLEQPEAAAVALRDLIDAD